MAPLKGLLVLALFLSAPPLLGQSTVPEELREPLDNIGFGPSAGPSMELYQPLLAQAPRGGIEVVKDLQYGPYSRNLLDVYRPEGIDGAPILIFVHGGGYLSGDRDLNEEVYGNVPTFFARNGLLGINATYRLATEASWPSGAEDMGFLIEWVKDHAPEYGGDPEQIFLMGHSAGATHAASYAFDSRFQPPEGHGLAGVVLVSGRYRLDWDPDDPGLEGIRRYFGTDPDLYPSRSPITHVPNSEIPALLVLAEYDMRGLVGTTGELFVELCRRDDGRCPRILQLRYHNHLSEIHHINTADDLLGNEILDFVHHGSARQLERSRAR